MLNRIQEALINAGAATKGGPINFNVAISTGDSLSFEVDCGSRGWFHVKASRHVSLLEQFEVYRLAHSRFPRFVPEPIACCSLGDLSIMIASFVDCDPLRHSDLSLGHWQRQLTGFFEDTRATQLNLEAGGKSQFKVKLDEYFAKLDGSDSRRCRYLREMGEAFEMSIPAIPQHGDLAINNLGNSRDRLVVFDWEDYGAVDAAGLDICMLALSATRLDVNAVRQIRDTPDPSGSPWAFAGPACVAIGLEFREFRRLLPLYLLAFRYLKRNYTTSIRGISDRLFDAAMP